MARSVPAPVRVEVRDKANSRRLLGYLVDPPEAGQLLGYLVAPPEAGQGWGVRLPMRPSLTCPLSSEAPPAIDTISVDFVFGHFVEDKGYTQRKKLLTDAPLEDLMRLGNFRLPGESEEAAHHRRWF